MPTDSATQTITIEAPFAEVLATIRDIASQTEWIPEILEAELLEVYEDDDLPATDEYTLSYEHTRQYELDDAEEAPGA